MAATHCTVESCDRPIRNKLRGLCNTHYLRVTRHGRLHSTRGERGKGTITSHGYKTIHAKYEHRILVESALGKPIPKGVEIHHVDGNKLNNAPTNLVVCQDRSYHHLLHMRQDALDTAGNPDYRKCLICTEYGDPNTMYEYASHSAKGKRYKHKQKNGVCV